MIYNTACGIYVLQNTETDQVRALFADVLNSNSSALGSSSLSNYARFLRVGPNVTPRSGGAKK